jgi:hypothetical protein
MNLTGPRNNLFSNYLHPFEFKVNLNFNTEGYFLPAVSCISDTIKGI